MGGLRNEVASSELIHRCFLQLCRFDEVSHELFRADTSRTVSKCTSRSTNTPILNTAMTAFRILNIFTRDMHTIGMLVPILVAKSALR